MVKVSKDPLDVARALFVVGAVVYAALEPGALYVIVTAVAVVAIRWAVLPRLFDATFIAAMALAGWGEALGAYELFVFYDELVHVAMPVMITPVVYILVSRLEVLRPLEQRGDPPSAAGIVVVGAMFGTAVAATWELVEWTADSLLGWSLMPSLRDTMVDLALGVLGAIAGAALLAIWSGRGWGTTRRQRPQR